MRPCLLTIASSLLLLTAIAAPAAAEAPPRCIGQGAYTVGETRLDTIYSRPGAVRSSLISCEDADHDRMELRVTGQPAHGEVTAAVERDADIGMVWATAWRLTYTPREAVTGVDSYFVTTNQVGGAPTEYRIDIVSRDRSENERPLCSGTNGGATNGGTLMQAPLGGRPYGDVTFLAGCTDADGDPLSFALTASPSFGTAEFRDAGAPGESYGQVWHHAGGGTGPAELSFSVSDGIAEPGAFHAPFSWPSGQGLGSAPLPPPVSAPTPLATARTTLESRAVRLVRRVGPARVYARAKRPKVGRAAVPLVVVCAVDCRISGRMQPFAGKRRAGKRSTTTRTARAGAAVLLQRKLSLRERRALRRAGGGVVETRLSVRPAGGRAFAGKVRLGMRRG